jgi:hypothetical protein
VLNNQALRLAARRQDRGGNSCVRSRPRTAWCLHTDAVPAPVACGACRALFCTDRDRRDRWYRCSSAASCARTSRSDSTEYGTGLCARRTRSEQGGEEFASAFTTQQQQQHSQRLARAFVAIRRIVGGRHRVSGVRRRASASVRACVDSPDRLACFDTGATYTDNTIRIITHTPC